MKNSTLAILFSVAISILIFSSCKASAQTNSGINIPGINLKGATNWAEIPYLKYDLTEHTFGYGDALLYKASDYVWTGVRIDKINGEQTTAGIQGQIQTTVTWNGVKFTPFWEASVGMGSSALYGSTGPGVFFGIYSHQFSRVSLNIGFIGDYEKVVWDAGQRNSNQANIGPLFHLSF